MVADVLKSVLAAAKVIYATFKNTTKFISKMPMFWKRKKLMKQHLCYTNSLPRLAYRAQTQVGSYYLQGGLGSVKKNKTTAAEWFYKAAKQGHARVQCNFGAILCYGDGIESDIKRGLKYLKESSRQSDKLAAKIYKKFKAILQTPQYSNVMTVAGTTK